MDKLLDDSALVELVRQSLARRRPQSTRTGRPSITPDRLLRCCVMKHLKGWSFRELELRGSLVYRVQEGNAAEPKAWVPALKHHAALFGRAPWLATADRGFFRRERAGSEGARVEKVALPGRAAPIGDPCRAAVAALVPAGAALAAGIEATVSTLKHPFAMWRATDKGELGFQRYVGWSIITKNLFSIARWRVQRRGHAPPC